MSRRAFWSGFSLTKLLYAKTVFLGAFLLFAVQPIAGKHLLPWFGGSSSVWATSLLFFTTALFVGYLYVYVLTRYGRGYQRAIHCAALVLALIPSLLSFFIWHSLFVSLVWTVGSTSPPSLNVLGALFMSISIPYLLLSTTGPLLQYWYGTSGGGEPYVLYALSNTGSLLGLLSYPFIVEPYLPLHLQEDIWLIGFFLYVLLCLWICLRHVRVPAVGAHEDSAGEKVSGGTLSIWVGLSALPAFLLVATTTQITQTIAPVPLLWVIPLAIYLVTLIAAFSGRGRSPYVPLLLLVASVEAYIYLSASPYEVLKQLSADVALLFFCGLACHALLYRLRPRTPRLPLFYLMVAFGGMLGTLGASIVPPLIFSDFYEFPLGLALSAIAAGLMVDQQFFPRLLGARKVRLTRILFCLLACTLFVQSIYNNADNRIASRNFYGNVAVVFHSDITVLMHGTTMHGAQLTDKNSSLMPTTYYVSGSGIGRAVLYEEQRRGKMPIRVGVIGLGTGTVASYCRPGDRYIFYEIDPRIPVIARNYFSYLPHCAGAEVREGDARIRLEAERAQRTLGAYDVLVVDAFADDTIPMHLLTLQALSLYAAHLRSTESIIAINTSSRYLTLAPIVVRLATQLGMSATVVFNDGSSSPAGTASQWVLVAKNPSIFLDSVFSGNATPMTKASDAVWTDDYTALLPALNLHWQ